MKIAEQWFHTDEWINEQKAANPNWKCDCKSCESARQIQTDILQGLAQTIQEKGLLAEKESKSWPEGTHQHDYRLGMAFAYQECLDLVQ